MASWPESVNGFLGTAATLPSASPSLALTSTSEVPVTAVESHLGYFSRNAWRAEQNVANASPPSAEPAVVPNRQDSAARPRAEVIVGLKKWEGRILEISDELLTVELTPSDHDGPELVADFHLALLGPDSSSAVPGDIIYLTTRTVRDATGYPYQTSSLKLRRPGAWGEDELREIADIAKKQAEFFKGT
jgi:hypothetical protein